MAMLLLNILPQVLDLLITQLMSTLIGHTNFFTYNIILSSKFTTGLEIGLEVPCLKAVRLFGNIYHQLTD